jgi:hypothetical protein
LNYDLNPTLIDYLKHLTLKPLHGGRNSKVFLVHDTVRSYIFKIYSERDSARERLSREFEFLLYCKERGIEQVPELIASDPVQNVMVLSHIPGEPIISPSTRDFRSCAEFFLHLNSDSLKGRIHLRQAIDRIFDGTSMIKAVQSRVFSTQKFLQNIDLTADMKFVKELNKSFLEYLCLTSTQVRHEYDEFEKMFFKKEVVSPSDFGFHNTLSCFGKLFFLDFEYSGIDSPIKLILDFLLQPDYLVQSDQEEQFLDSLAPLFKSGDIAIPKTLRNVFMIKWINIIWKSAFSSEDETFQRKKVLQYLGRHSSI